MARARKFELFIGDLGGGLTICNKAVEINGDYKTIAFISREGELKWYVSADYCPPEAKKSIEDLALKEEAKYKLGEYK